MRITAGGTLIKDGKLLLGFRSSDKTYYPNTWDIFGGHCERGETPPQTLIRECMEELGVTPLRYHKLATMAEPHPALYGSGHHHIYAVYAWAGEPANLGNEHQVIQWFTRDEFTQLALASPQYITLFGTLV